MNAEEQIEFNAQEKGIVFGQLGGFGIKTKFFNLEHF